MPKELSAGRPNTRRYSPEEKERAVRMVRQLRKELGTSQGTVGRVAGQLGYGVESMRLWVKQAGIDAGEAPGVTTADAARIRELEQENRELRRANEILKAASALMQLMAIPFATAATSSCGPSGAVRARLHHPLWSL